MASKDTDLTVDVSNGSKALGKSFEEIQAAERQEIRQYPDWKIGDGESVLHFAKRLCTEGHTRFDAWLVAAGCIGQIMLTTPNGWFKAGLIPGLLFITAGAIIGFWTMWQFTSLYYDRKRNLIEKGEWYDDPKNPVRRKHSTQLQELMGHFMGRRWQVAVTGMMIITWIGAGVVQILACATDMYAIDQSFSKRKYALVFGAALLPFGFIPSFRHLRIILVFGVFSTLFTSAYAISEAIKHGFTDYRDVQLWPTSFQTLFTGAAVLYQILDHHTVAAETIEAMQHPKGYYKTYALGFFPLFFMIVPPGLLLNLSYPKTLPPQNIQTADNLFFLTPYNAAKVAAVWFMMVHQVQAFALWMTPFGFLWEKMLGVHNRAWYIRLPSRAPYLIFIYVFALMFPFYGAVNSLISSLCGPLLAYTVPCLAFNMAYRTKEARQRMLWPTARRVTFAIGWNKIFAINYLLIAYGVVLVGFSASMSIKTLVDNVKTFSIFPDCYGCKLGTTGPSAAANTTQVLLNATMALATNLTSGVPLG